MKPKEKPIIFSAPMINAILDGRKTQTRRLIKPQPSQEGMQFSTIICDANKRKEGRHRWVKVAENGYDIVARDEQTFNCPHPTGSVMWVRETWGVSWRAGDYVMVQYKVVGEKEIQLTDWDGELEQAIRAMNYGWRPSIHMPRWASRIDLLGKNVRVERLKDITEKDAIAEGIDADDALSRLASMTLKQSVAPAILGFQETWNSIHGPGAWERNDWVWVYEFERIKP